jgi:acetate kinase
VKPVEESLLTINGGSSSIKFALYPAIGPMQRWLYGQVDRIGLDGTTLSFHDAILDKRGTSRMEASPQGSAAQFLVDWLGERIGLASIRAVGHRVVYGLHYAEPQRVTEQLLDSLRRIEPYDPEHLPREIELIEAFRQPHPELLQVACFDTAFHQTMPRVARLLPIPRRFDALGIQRFGFHGLSYAYLMEELARVAGAQAAHGRVILAHLGNGASLAAVRDGKSIDTSMGFTPAAGLPMGTRSGDLDPGVARYMMQAGNLSPQQFSDIVNRESGLLGVSGISSDMRDLMRRQASDVGAAEAVELFCYQVRKWIGAYAAALGGLDTLVFAGGIGENAAEVRARVCKGLEFLGIELSEAQNAVNAFVISADARPVRVHVIRTDEELMIARAVSRLLGDLDRASAPSGT